MLENRNFARKCTHIWSLRRYTFLCEGSFTFHDDNVFCKKSGFFCISNTFSQSNSLRAVLDFLVLISVLIIYKANVYGNISFTDHESGFRHPDCSKVDLKWEKWPLSRKMIMMPEFVNMTSSTNFFNVVVFYLSSFVSNFHFIIITGFGVMTIFVYKGLAGNLEYENTQVWIFLFKWPLRRARDTKFCKHISNKIFLVSTKRHDYSLDHF